MAPLSRRDEEHADSCLLEDLLSLRSREEWKERTGEEGPLKMY